MPHRSEERPGKGAHHRGRGKGTDAEDSTLVSHGTAVGYTPPRRKSGPGRWVRLADVVTPETAALLDFDVDELLRLARGRALPPAEVLAAARRRNRARAFLFLQDAARRGVRSEDPATEALLGRFRRDALREAGVDERLVRRTA